MYGTRATLLMLHSQVHIASQWSSRWLAAGACTSTPLTPGGVPRCTSSPQGRLSSSCMPRAGSHQRGSRFSRPPRRSCRALCSLTRGGQSSCRWGRQQHTWGGGGGGEGRGKAAVHAVSDTVSWSAPKNAAAAED
jgi:hypothetical protein